MRGDDVPELCYVVYSMIRATPDFSKPGEISKTVDTQIPGITKNLTYTQ